jgi:hypothetical protein
MSTAALLATLQMKQGELTYYTQQQIFWARKYEDATAALQTQTNLESKWEEKYDKFMDLEDDKKVKIGGTEYTGAQLGTNRESKAEQYANEQVKGYDEAKLEELTEEDIQYESMKTMYEALQKELQAEVDNLNEKVGNEAGKTYLIGGG